MKLATRQIHGIHPQWYRAECERKLGLLIRCGLKDMIHRLHRQIPAHDRLDKLECTLARTLLSDEIGTILQKDLDVTY